MTNYLIKPIGNVDIEITNKCKFKKLNYCKRPDIKNSLDKARIDGEKLLKQLEENNKLIEYLEFPIINKGSVFCKKYFKEQPFTLLFVLTDQKNKPHDADTVHFGEIIKLCEKKITNSYNIKLGFITLTNDLSEFNKNYDELSQYFNNEKEDIIKFDYSDDEVVVFTQAGLPETRVALLLHCIQRFSKEVVQIAAPVDSKEAIGQNFPKEFRENLRKNIFPHALKETLAIISAKNLSHTDGSHIMPWVAKNEFSGNEIFATYNEYLKNTMDLTADLIGGMGKQSLINYKFSDIDSYLNNLFNAFLGKGLTDGQGEANIIIDEALKDKTISLPGGENGKNALVVILKNFFRNLYKHSCPNSANKYIGKLQLEECESDEFYKISLTEVSKGYNEETVNKTIKKINSLISETILNEDLTKRETGWGIMEMKIAAAYIIGLPIDLFERVVINGDEKYPLPFIKASKKENGDGCYNLKYTFYLLKSKIALIENNKDLLNSPMDLPTGFNWQDGNGKKNVRSRHEFFIRLTKGKDAMKLKASNIKQIYFNSKDEMTKCLSESALKSKWVADFQKKIVGADNIRVCALWKDSAISDNCDQIKKYCVFDDHGSWHEANSAISLKDLYYYEKFNSSEEPKHLVKKDAMQNSIEIKDESRAIETVLTNIAIIDERIQKDALNTEDINLQDYKLFNLYDLKRIYIPSPYQEANCDDVPFKNWAFKKFDGDKCSLNILMYGTEKNESASRFEFLAKMLKYYFYEKNCHYVVLHLSGFETIVKESFDYLKEKITDYKENNINKAFWYLLSDSELGGVIKDESKYLVLTSGKGTTATVPDGSYFVSFGNLEFALKKNKYELVKLLNSIRKLKK